MSMSSVPASVMEQIPFYHPFFIDQRPFLPRSSCSSTSSSISSTPKPTHSRASSDASTSTLTFTEATHTSFIPGLPRDHPFNSSKPSSPRLKVIDQREQAAWIAKVSESEHLFGSVGRRGRKAVEVEENTETEEVEKKKKGKWFRR